MSDIKPNGRFTDLTNMEIGDLTPLFISGKDKHGKFIWNCKCKCGNICHVTSSELTKNGGTRSCGCKKMSRRWKNELGNVYGKLTVLKEDKKGFWVCRCECGNEKTFIAGDLRKAKSCGCNADRGMHNRRWKGHKNLSGSYWDNIKRSAKARGHVFDITLEYAWDIFQSQHGLCALSGLPIKMTYDNEKKQHGTASIDRIDNTIGYVVGNIQWLHYDVNIMKQTLSVKDFLELCRNISNFNKQRK